MFAIGARCDSTTPNQATTVEICCVCDPVKSHA
jgi:hypothetical protein